MLNALHTLLMVHFPLVGAERCDHLQLLMSIQFIKLHCILDTFQVLVFNDELFFITFNSHFWRFIYLYFFLFCLIFLKWGFWSILELLNLIFRNLGEIFNILKRYVLFNDFVQSNFVSLLLLYAIYRLFLGISFLGLARI